MAAPTGGSEWKTPGRGKVLNGIVKQTRRAWWGTKWWSKRKASSGKGWGLVWHCLGARRECTEREESLLSFKVLSLPFAHGEDYLWGNILWLHAFAWSSVHEVSWQAWRKELGKAHCEVSFGTELFLFSRRGSQNTASFLESKDSINKN